MRFYLLAPSVVAPISEGRGSGGIEDSAGPLSEGSASPQQEHLLPFLSIETVTSPPPADNAGYLPHTNTYVHTQKLSQVRQSSVFVYSGKF